MMTTPTKSEASAAAKRLALAWTRRHRLPTTVYERPDGGFAVVTGAHRWPGYPDRAWRQLCYFRPHPAPSLEPVGVPT